MDKIAAAVLAGGRIDSTEIYLVAPIAAAPFANKVPKTCGAITAMMTARCPRGRGAVAAVCLDVTVAAAVIADVAGAFPVIVVAAPRRRMAATADVGVNRIADRIVSDGPLKATTAAVAANRVEGTDSSPLIISTAVTAAVAVGNISPAIATATADVDVMLASVSTIGETMAACRNVDRVADSSVSQSVMNLVAVIFVRKFELR